MSFYAMNSADRRELDAYRALGTVEELAERIRNPYPAANAGYSPMPGMDDEWPLYEADKSTIADDTSRWTK